MTPVTAFVIDRTVWLRGEGIARSKLLRPDDGKRCCVGIYLGACGVADEALSGVPAAHNAVNVPDMPRWLLEDVGGLYADNDAYGGLTEERREELIADGFARRGITVTFIN